MDNLADPRVINLGRACGWRAFARPGLPQRRHWHECMDVSGPTMRLAFSNEGPFAFANDFVVGGLAPRHGFAIADDRRVYWLRPRDARLLELTLPGIQEDAQPCFVPLQSAAPEPTAMKVEASDILCERIADPTTIAAMGSFLIVADAAPISFEEHDGCGGAARVFRQFRVFVLDRRTWATREVWCFDTPAIDIAATASAFFVLLEPNERGDTQSLVRIEFGQRTSRSLAIQSDSYARILIDRRERLFLKVHNQGSLVPMSNDLQCVQPAITDIDSIREHFLGVPLAYIEDKLHSESNVVVVAKTLGADGSIDLVGRSFPAPRGGKSDYWFFDEQGDHFTPTAPIMPPTAPFVVHGTWISQPLDSRQFQCVWDRLEVALGESEPLPVGTEIRIGAYAVDEELSLTSLSTLPTEAWALSARLTTTARGLADADSSRDAPDWLAPPPNDYLLSTPPGQFLSLRIDMRGDGYATPTLAALEVHFPRDSFLQYLPAVYTADEATRGYLERLLAVFQAPWRRIEELAESTWRFLDASAIPEDMQLLEMLGRRLGFSMPPGWNPAQRRRLLRATRSLFVGDHSPASHGGAAPSRLCTVDGLRTLLRVYLANLVLDDDSSPDDVERMLASYPVLVECFRERLTCDNKATARNVSDRVVLDDHEAKLGTRLLVSPGDAREDPIYRHSHRFRVVVPQAWVRSHEDAALLRAALDAEKPAHTDYDLVLAPGHIVLNREWPRVGMDTILGDGVWGELEEEGTQAAPAPLLARPLTLPGDEAQQPGLILTAEPLVGIDTTLN